MKTRVQVYKNNRFIPQYKRFWFWRNYWDTRSISHILIEFSTLDDAIKFIKEVDKRKYKKESLVTFVEVE